jgi:hypothetical protein
MTCTNCKATMTCGCQKRVASNGVSVCSNCHASYEASLGRAKVSTTPSTSTAPSNVSVKYNPPRK